MNTEEGGKKERVWVRVWGGRTRQECNEENHQVQVVRTEVNSQGPPSDFIDWETEVCEG